MSSSDVSFSFEELMRWAIGCCAVIAFITVLVCMKVYHIKAVENGCAEYNSKTGGFEWRGE